MKNTYWNSKLQQTTIAIAMLLTIGCSTQPSTYVDNSTADQRDIQATGAAATAAAHSNNSKNVDIEVNSNVPLVRGTNVSSLNYQELPGVCCAYNSDGTRNYEREHEIYIQKQYGRIQRDRRNTYSGYASQRAKQNFKNKMERKIDEKINHFLNKLF